MRAHDAVTRTQKIAGYAHNSIFDIHTALLRLVPLAIAHMHPTLYQNAKDHITDMTRADYFYVISYPTYSGFKVEHDPTYTAYIEMLDFPAEGVSNWRLFLLVGIGVAAVVVIGAVFALK